MPVVNSNYAGNGNGNGRYNRSNNERDRRGYNNYGSDSGQRDDFSYEITDSYGVLSESSTGWRKELNRVSWNGNSPKFDIREWSPDHGRMRRGVTFTEEEALELKDLLEAAIAGLPVSTFDGADDTDVEEEVAAS